MDVSLGVVIAVVVAFGVGVVMGVVLTSLASRSSHPVEFDWRLRVRRNDDEHPTTNP